MKFLKSAMNSHYAMMAICCLAMVGAYFAFSTGSLEGSTLSSLAPIIACVVMHFVMMKMMGKSCHKKTDEQQETTEQSVSKQSQAN